MNIKQLATATIDFLLASTSVVQRAQMLIECADKNDMTGLQKLITADPGVIKRAGEEAVAQACSKGHLDIVKRLHRLGAPINNTKYYQGSPAVVVAQYPFHCAMNNQHWHVAEWLIAENVKAVHIHGALENMVSKAPQLFGHMLKTVRYIAAYESPSQERLSGEEKALADTFKRSLEALCAQDDSAFATIVLESGLSARRLYDAAMKQHAYAVLRSLYLAGYRPDAKQKAAHMRLLDKETCAVERAISVRALVQAWLPADRHVAFDDETLQMCREALALEFSYRFVDKGLFADESIPAALVLARAGRFLRDVAPLLPQTGAALLLLSDQHGVTVAEALIVRSELYQAFDPAVWGGHFSQALALHAALPPTIQAQLDLNIINAAFDRYRMGGGATRFKLPPRDKNGAP